MSKRAEEMALKAFPEIEGNSFDEDLENTFNKYRREGFINGYEQAEKDLALTCEDVAYIVDTFYIVEGSVKEKCEEVLRRFNEYKKLV